MPLIFKIIGYLLQAVTQDGFFPVFHLSPNAASEILSHLLILTVFSYCHSYIMT